MSEMMIEAFDDDFTASGCDHHLDGELDLEELFDFIDDSKTYANVLGHMCKYTYGHVCGHVHRLTCVQTCVCPSCERLPRSLTSSSSFY